MAAMYCENGMTAGWTFDIASLEHGKAPRLSLMFHYLPSSHSAVGPIRAKRSSATPSPATCRTELRSQSWIEAEPRRAVGAADRVPFAHVDIDMRVIVRRRYADAFELPRPDSNLGYRGRSGTSESGFRYVRVTDRPSYRSFHRGEALSAVALANPRSVEW
jgi:hypothetical protein